MHGGSSGASSTAGSRVSLVGKGCKSELFVYRDQKEYGPEAYSSKPIMLGAAAPDTGEGERFLRSPTGRKHTVLEANPGTKYTINRPRSTEPRG